MSQPAVGFFLLLSTLATTPPNSSCGPDYELRVRFTSWCRCSARSGADTGRFYGTRSNGGKKREKQGTSEPRPSHLYAGSSVGRS